MSRTIFLISNKDARLKYTSIGFQVKCQFYVLQISRRRNKLVNKLSS